MYSSIMLMVGILLLTFLLGNLSIASASVGPGLISTFSSCNYPGNILTFECTVEGGSVTVWKGSAFDLCEQTEISLLHDRFNQTNGTEIKINCNTMTIIGRSVSSNNNMFLSQVSLVSNCELDGLIIECEQDNFTVNQKIGNSTINVSALPPPKDLSSTKGQGDQLIFTWTQGDTNCSTTAKFYNIVSSNCGTCPTTTNNTNITCTNIPMDSSLCTLRVQSEPCGTAARLTVTLEFKDAGANSVSVGMILAILFGIIISIIGAALVLLVGYILKQKKHNDSSTGLNMHPPKAPDQDVSHHQDIEAAANAVELIVTEKNYSYVDVRRNLYLQKTNNESRSRDFTSKAATVRAEDEYLNLDSLLIKLHGKVTNKWYELGMAVHVPQVFLNKIKGYPNEECVVKVLDYWLKIHPDQPTWKEMADALEDIQEYELASSIKGIYKQDAPHTTG